MRSSIKRLEKRLANIERRLNPPKHPLYAALHKIVYNPELSFEEANQIYCGAIREAIDGNFMDRGFGEGLLATKDGGSEGKSNSILQTGNS